MKRFNHENEYINELAAVGRLIKEAGDAETGRQLREYRLILEFEYFRLYKSKINS